MEEHTVVYPGHGAITTIGAEKSRYHWSKRIR
jgi:hypothetical protein